MRSNARARFAAKRSCPAGDLRTYRGVEDARVAERDPVRFDASRSLMGCRRKYAGIIRVLSQDIRIMKTKLTITIDEDLLPRAKNVARRRGVSLSSVIEESLRRLATEETDFVSRWRGKFKEVETDDPRMTYLKEKYLADPD
jgi:hypothetical protein